MAPIDLRKPGRPIRVGIILTLGRTEILDISPIDLLTGISKEFVSDFPDELVPSNLKAQALDFEWHWVNQTGEAASLTCGAHVKITDTFATCPPLDIAIMGATTLGYQPNKEELAFVRKTYDDCTVFLTICGGMMVPLQAGLLAGKTATAPAMMLDMLRAQTEASGVPKEHQTKWVQKRWHVSEDGKMWTSGTLLNGTDMMREFGRQTWGGEGSLMDIMADLGAWPARDVDYRPMVVTSEA